MRRAGRRWSVAEASARGSGRPPHPRARIAAPGEDRYPVGEDVPRTGEDVRGPPGRRGPSALRRLSVVYEAPADSTGSDSRWENFPVAGNSSGDGPADTHEPRNGISAFSAAGDLATRFPGSVSAHGGSPRGSCDLCWEGDLDDRLLLRDVQRPPDTTRVLAFRGTEALSALYGFEMPPPRRGSRLRSCRRPRRRRDVRHPDRPSDPSRSTASCPRSRRTSSPAAPWSAPSSSRGSGGSRSRAIAACSSSRALPAILDAVLQGAGLMQEDYTLKLTGTYGPWSTSANTGRAASPSSRDEWSARGSTTSSSRATTRERLIITDDRAFHDGSRRARCGTIQVSGAGASGIEGLHAFLGTHSSIPGSVRVPRLRLLRPGPRRVRQRAGLGRRRRRCTSTARTSPRRKRARASPACGPRSSRRASSCSAAPGGAASCGRGTRSRSRITRASASTAPTW